MTAIDAAIDAYDRLPHATSMIVRRPAIKWPGGARVAVAFVVSTEYYEMRPPADAFVPPNVPGGFGRAPYPDVRAFSQREYGNRVGIYRVMQAFDKRGMVATAAVDESVATRYPGLVKELVTRKWEIAGHGFSLTQVISDKMSEDKERATIKSALDTLARVTGQRPKGWHGPEYGQSQRTPRLLAELGVDYVLDWPNDEQPFLMHADDKPLVSLAMALELDDVVSAYHRRLSLDRWTTGIGVALDQLLADSTASGRHLIVNLHPWIIGHPHRIGYLEDVLDDVSKRKGLWLATAGDIAAHYRAQTVGAAR
jgi:peptidoglycan/xylan/chitin deacetylase (PgdA/CDA1 family)